MTVPYKTIITRLAILACLLLVPREVYAEADIPEEIRDNGIPIIALTVDPADFERVVNSEDHSEEATGDIEIDVPEGYKGDFSETELADMGPLKLEYVRGRGNATWTYEKKPFKIKLDKKASLLGMGAAKEWALLANSNDTSFMRNRLVSYIGRNLGMEFEPKMLPVDFVVNGKYMGSYVLSQQVEIDPTRVAIDKLTTDDINEPEVTGGYLLAMEPYPEEPEGNTFTTGKGVRFQSDSPVFASNNPDKKLGTQEQKDYIFGYLQKVEDAIYGEGMKDRDGVPYSDYMDLKTSADYWWVQEYTINSDAFVTDSTRLYKKRSGKLYWGPLWDFDMSTFADFPGEGFNNSEMPWLDYMRAFDPEYQKILKEEWARFSDITDEIVKEGGIIDQYRDETRKSWEDNDKLWGGDGEEPLTFDDLVEGLRKYYIDRSAWINANIDSPEFTDIFSKITFLVDNEEYATALVRKDKWIDESILPPTPEKEGYLFLGWLDPNGNPADSGTPTDEDIALTASFIKEEEAVKADDIYFYCSEDWFEINEGDYMPYFTLVPENVQDKRITWEFSDPDLISVDQNETFHFKEKKTGDITVTAKISSGKSRSFILHLYDETKTEILPVSSITPEKASLTMKVGEYAQMPLTIRPKPSRPSLSYSSGYENVAVVDGCGMVKALAPGTTVIKIIEDNEGIEAEYKVTVAGSEKKKLANPITLKVKKVTLKAKKLKKKARTISRKKAIRVKKAKGKLTYKLVSVKKAKFKKYFKVNKKSGKITVKKKLRKGTYKLKIKITAAGNLLYKKGSKTAVVKIIVK